MGPNAMILVFWILSFRQTFSLSSFTFIKRLFSSSSLYAIRVGSSAYLRLLIFLPAMLIPDCASSSPAFLMRYSAYKLNKQGNFSIPFLKYQCFNKSQVCFLLISSPVNISKILSFYRHSKTRLLQVYGSFNFKALKFSVDNKERWKNGQESYKSDQEMAYTTPLAILYRPKLSNMAPHNLIDSEK